MFSFKFSDKNNIFIDKQQILNEKQSILVQVYWFQYKTVSPKHNISFSTKDAVTIIGINM
ncbi:hypothetical protein GENT5_06030 [Flavobacterium ammoniigenes]|uniref:Uncharacterized protein n=1 Tax=Flavobacterium ammoniigenes TaxID=1751095 RepID=A0ABN6KY67_9FLAO|nr:hypothetical protein GENT5_06030 [Flavobacterium ammoniigenes]